MKKTTVRRLTAGAIFAVLCGCSGCSIVAGRVCGLFSAGAYRGVEVCVNRVEGGPDSCGPGGIFGQLLYLPIAFYWMLEFPFVFVVDSVCYPVDMSWAIAVHGLDEAHGWSDIEWRPRRQGYHHPANQFQCYFWNRFASQRILKAIHDERPISLEDVNLAGEMERRIPEWLSRVDANAAELVRRQDALYLRVVQTSERVRRLLEDESYPVDEVTDIFRNIRAIEQEYASLDSLRSEYEKSQQNPSMAPAFSDEQFRDIEVGCRIMREVLESLRCEQELKAKKRNKTFIR